MAEAGHDQDTPPRKVRRIDEAAERKDEVEVHWIKIDHLPDEVLIIIFSSFSFNDLVDNVQNVCTRWKRLAHDPVLWLDKEYIIRGNQMYAKSCCGWSKCSHCRIEGKDERILRTAAATPQLRKLTLMRSVKTSVLEKIVTYWPNLAVLKIDGCFTMEYDLMKHIFENCPNIWKMKVGASVLLRQRDVELLSTLEHLCSLEVFVDRHCLQSVSYRHLARFCPRLEEIKFEWWGHDEDDAADFLKAKQGSITSASLYWILGRVEEVCVVPLLKQCHRLRKLELGFYHLPHHLAAEAFEALGELHSLEELSIDRANPRPPELMSLAFRPGRLTQLRRLVVNGADQLQNETLVAISQGCPNLCELRLYGIHCVTDEGLGEIHCLKHLKILEIVGCSGLGGSAVAHIAALPALHTLSLPLLGDLAAPQPGVRDILDMKQLRHLHISRCSDARAVPLHEFPARLLKLRELRVGYDEGDKLYCKNVFAELQRRMPHLQLEDDASEDEDSSSSSGGNDSFDCGDTDYYYDSSDGLW